MKLQLLNTISALFAPKPVRPDPLYEMAINVCDQILDFKNADCVFFREAAELGIEALNGGQHDAAMQTLLAIQDRAEKIIKKK